MKCEIQFPNWFVSERLELTISASFNLCDVNQPIHPCTELFLTLDSHHKGGFYKLDLNVTLNSSSNIIIVIQLML
jgi:hypothetical protein